MQKTEKKKQVSPSSDIKYFMPSVLLWALKHFSRFNRARRKKSTHYWLTTEDNVIQDNVMMQAVFYIHSHA